MRLKSKLLSLNANKAVPTKIYSPANCEEVRIPFRQDKIAKVVGRLAGQIQPPTSLPSPPSSDSENGSSPEEKKAKLAAEDSNQIVTGVLVQNDLKLSLMAPEDLKEYAGLTTTTILCRQRLTLSAAGVDLIKWALEGTFGSIKILSQPNMVQNGAGDGDAKLEDADEKIQRETETVFEVMGAVRVKVGERGAVEVEWEGNIQSDGIADAVLTVLFSVESSPAAVRRKLPPSHRTPTQQQGDLATNEKQSLRNSIRIRILIPMTKTRRISRPETSTPTSRPKNGSRACACSSNRTLANTP